MISRASYSDGGLLRPPVQSEATEAGRGKLKIFFGFAPGVGKTHAMVEAARQLHRRGAEVVALSVDTHGCAQTNALLDGIEILAQPGPEPRGRLSEQRDLDLAVERKPQIVLVDDLARSNAPGSRHKKRWQDVFELLDAGIEVHGTLDVAQVESLNDVVAQITGVTVSETVPDQVLDRADEIVLVDLTIDELLGRFAAGKIHIPADSEATTRGLFQRGSLLALRELALRRTAEHVDVQVRAFKEAHDIAASWATHERILVCVGPAPSSAQLVRAARRMAASLHCHWLALTVDVITAPPIVPAARARLEGHLRLAESLGATVAQVSGQRISEAVVDYARKHHVSRVLIGKPTHPRWRDLWRGSIVEDVVRASGEIDVHVMRGDTGPDEEPAARPARRSPRYLPYAWAVVMVALATLAAWLLRDHVLLPDVAMTYLAVIMVVAVSFERGPAFLATALSVAAYDVFFIEPFYTLSVHDLQNVLTFAMMLATALLISTLTGRIRGQELAARSREERTATLLRLSRALSGAFDEQAVARAACRELVRAFGGGAAVLASGDGTLTELAREGDLDLGVPERGVAQWVLDHQHNAGHGTDTLAAANALCVPLSSKGAALGVLVVSPALASTLSGDQRAFLDTFVRQLTLAFERGRLAEAARAAALRAKTEEMRSALLSAVSHDLRTPLAAITGAATTVRDDQALDDTTRRELVETVCEEAVRLERLVSNLLEMTRLESGGLRAKKEWVPLEEMVGAALARLDATLADRQVAVTIPEELPLAHVDPVLGEQVFVNLLENAAKHTPAGTPIEIEATVDQGLVVEVRDRGPGIPAEHRSLVFDKFFRRQGAPGGGVGLGLAICKGIVEVHGGGIEVRDRPGGGAVFRLRWPLDQAPPVALPADELMPRAERQEAV